MSLDASKSFLARLQESDDATKKRWLIGSTTVIMIGVIALWFVYFNTLVHVAEPQSQNVSELATAKETAPPLWTTMGRGATVIGDALKNAVGGLGDMIGGSQEYIIQ